MSDTPRTDVAEFWFRPADRTLCKYDGKVVYAIVSKTLERELATTQAALKLVGEALKEAGDTIATAAKEKVYYPDHKRILFKGMDVTFKEMCELTCDIAKKALSHPAMKQL